MAHRILAIEKARKGNSGWRELPLAICSATTTDEVTHQFKQISNLIEWIQGKGEANISRVTADWLKYSKYGSPDAHTLSVTFGNKEHLYASTTVEGPTEVGVLGFCELIRPFLELNEGDPIPAISAQNAADKWKPEVDDRPLIFRLIGKLQRSLSRPWVIGIGSGVVVTLIFTWLANKK